jgi:hypothetical protein
MKMPRHFHGDFHGLKTAVKVYHARHQRDTFTGGYFPIAPVKVCLSQAPTPSQRLSQLHKGAL